MAAQLVAVAAAAALTIAPGLTYSERECTVGSATLLLQELRHERTSPTELGALRNPTAAPNPRCRGGYGGKDLPKLLESLGPGIGHGVLAATNGTLFREHGRRYLSNHLLWAKNAGLIAPIRRAGGSTIFVADPKGGHEVKVRFETCPRARGRAPGPSACVRVLSPALKPFAGKGALPPDAFVQSLQAAFPAMTLAIQSNMPLDERASRCSTDAEGRPRGGDWRCRSAARTILCARADGSISLITTPGAYPSDLAQGLRIGGACGTGCRLLYNLDGGGSTQLGRREGAEWVMSGSRMETGEPACSPYRPVDHYLVFTGRR